MAHLLVSANPGIDLANEPRYTDFLRSLPDGSKKVFNNRGYTFDDWEKSMRYGPNGLDVKKFIIYKTGDKANLDTRFFTSGSVTLNKLSEELSTVVWLIGRDRFSLMYDNGRIPESGASYCYPEQGGVEEMIDRYWSVYNAPKREIAEKVHDHPHILNKKSFGKGYKLPSTRVITCLKPRKGNIM
jgi:hypothetical protein|tara:strand:+ start:2134 stop:2688 length:555 start_codon:yes stop_codon:yes gene_type:complete